ncbi:ADP-ribosyl-[dinitrogen reductase] hydrolase [Halorientalis regularis]|uniref:ADP-ribosyl-[dinitrogen reductase] hydrolase n=2 Tax=Halorientalis regularis TaxID=660518 RepID=A0A1G7QB53_9EURY|nr:ADP-ribosyl-[dinitrogen reductase] hydrolase [Halorientalis regularis]
MLGHGTHGQPPGTITDDTEMALCIARSLAERGQFDPEDIAARFVEWYDSGPFDIGVMTADALRQIKSGASLDEAGQMVWEQRPEGQNAGNGSVMRCVPHALAFADGHETLVEVSRQSSSITHADPRCTTGCAILNSTVAGLIEGRDDALADSLSALHDVPAELRDALAPIPDGIEERELASSGYVVHTLQTALYLGLTADSAEETIVTAVNMGDDTDTVGAVTGAVAGARFGVDSLPDRWFEELDCEVELRSLATTLYEDPITS